MRSWRWCLPRSRCSIFFDLLWTNESRTKEQSHMKAVELNGFEGLSSLQVVDVEQPTPGANEVLLEVKAAGLNFAEIEMTKGKYPAGKKLPFVMGFEAAGVVVDAGAH